MLTIFRRHLAACPFKAKGWKHRTCRCPISVQGTLRGEKIRRALDITSWEAAQRTVREWESLGGLTGEAVTVETASAKYLKDCEARNLKEATLVLRRRFLERQLIPWCEDKGFRFVGSLGIEELRQFRESWTCEPITALKRLERLRHFFRFVQESGWVKENPARLLHPPKVSTKPTMPFSPEEMGRIVEACGKYPYQPERMKAFVLTLRYSGLRLGDAVGLERSRLEKGRLLLRTAKTGTLVYVPLPPHVGKMLEALPDRFFWNGGGTLKSAMTVWDRSLRTLFKLAKVEDGHAHRFRHTFAVELLTKNVSMETVSVLLGHTSLRITEKHYAAFSKSRQVALEDAVKKAWDLPAEVLPFRKKA